MLYIAGRKKCISFESFNLLNLMYFYTFIREWNEWCNKIKIFLLVSLLCWWKKVFTEILNWALVTHISRGSKVGAISSRYLTALLVWNEVRLYDFNQFDKVTFSFSVRNFWIHFSSQLLIHLFNVISLNVRTRSWDSNLQPTVHPHSELVC